MFSKSTEYALRATVYIAQHSDETTKLSLDEVAEGIASPRAFTAKILQKLTAGNKVIHSVRGPGGGFYITTKSLKLPIREVLDAMEEEEVLQKCILGLKKCSDAQPCPMHDRYKVIKASLLKLFSDKTIGELAADDNHRMY